MGVVAPGEKNWNCICLTSERAHLLQLLFINITKRHTVA